MKSIKNILSKKISTKFIFVIPSFSAIWLFVLTPRCVLNGNIDKCNMELLIPYMASLAIIIPLFVIYFLHLLGEDKMDGIDNILFFIATLIFILIFYPIVWVLI